MGDDQEKERYDESHKGPLMFWFLFCSLDSVVFHDVLFFFSCSSNSVDRQSRDLLSHPSDDYDDQASSAFLAFLAKIVPYIYKFVSS